MSDSALTPEEQAAIDDLFALSEEGTLYELFEVASDADRKTIQEAFYELSRKWHPDRFFRRDVGEYGERIEAVFVAVTEAWRTLGNEASRFTYDLENRDLIQERHSGVARGPAGPRPPRAAAGGMPTQLPGPRGGRRRKAAASGARPGASERRDKAMADVRKRVIARLKKARLYHREAVKHYEEGRIMKANSAIQLARTYDGRNAEIAQLCEQYQGEARKLQSKGFVAAAESADSFANYREALQNYRKAVEYGTDNARAHYRLGLLTKRVDEDRREALKHMREAIKMSPDSIEFRMGIGELYEELGLAVNARAQYKRVLELDKFHPDAKERLKGLKATK